MAEIRGVLPVLQTPFCEDEQVDWECLSREVAWALRVGADGICSAMVSEWLRLVPEERTRYMNLMVEAAGGQGIVVASVGAESTIEAVRYARAAENAGCDAVMAIPPIGAVLPESELETHFCRIAQSVSLPLIVQDASSYVGHAFSLELMARLLDRFGPDKILFKPEAAPLGPNLSALRDATAGSARVFDGSGGIMLIDAYRRGITGTIPAVDLLESIVALWKALEQGDEERAYEIYLPLCAMVALQMQAGLDGFLAIEKYLLVKHGVFTSARRRRPITWELDDETRAEVDRLDARLRAALDSGQTGR